MSESKDTSAQLNPAGIERRTAERSKPLQATTCRLVLAGREETRWARIENVCAMGLGLLLSTSCDPGTELIIRLKGQNGRFAVSLPARVAHATARPDGAWIVGCALSHPLSEQQLQDLQ